MNNNNMLHQKADLLSVFSVPLTLIPFFNPYFFLLHKNTQTNARPEYPKFVKIVEVGPRDGLQNEKVQSFQS